MPAEDRQRHWVEAAERIALVGAVAVVSVIAIHWLFVHWSFGASGKATRDWPVFVAMDVPIKTGARLVLSSLATIVLLGSEVLLFRWWFRR